MFNLCNVVGLVGSLQAPRKAEDAQVKMSPVRTTTVGCSHTQDSGTVSVAASSAVEPKTLSSITDSFSSTSSPELDEVLVMKSQPPPALFPSKLPNTATLPCPKLPHVFLVGGKMTREPDERSLSVQDVEGSELIPSISSGTNLEKNSRLTVEGTDVRVEPQTFHTNFSGGRNAVGSSVEEESHFEGSPAHSSKSGSEVIDVNENISKKEFVNNHCKVEDSKMAVTSLSINGLSDQQKVMSELFDNSRYLPVTTSTVVVNMVLSTVVAQPEDQNSTALEPDAANNSRENSECDMSMSDEASTQEASSLMSSEVVADKKSEQQEEKSSSVVQEGSPCHANDGNKSDAADQIPSLEEGSRMKRKKSKSPKHKKSKSPGSEKRQSRSRSKKRDRSQSRERKKHRSRSSRRKRNRSRSNDRSGKRSATKSPAYSPKRNSSRQKDRKRSRSLSRNRQRSSSPRDHHSRTRRTSPSRSSRRREHSRSRSREIRRRSRSRSRDSKRRSRSTDRARHKRKTHSPSKDERKALSPSKDQRKTLSPSRDHSRRSVSKDRKASRDKDTERKDEKSRRQVDRASTSFSRNYPSDRSRDSPHQRDRSPPRGNKVTAKRNEGTGNSDIGRSVSSHQSDSDMSGAESSQRRRSREENVSENNRIAVISSSSNTNRQHRHEEFEVDEEPPADLPTAYDPSEPTEDNFRDDRKVSDRRMPPHWVPPANQRMPVVDTSRPPPGFAARLPAPPVARFPHGPPREDVKANVVPPNQFGVVPSDGSRPPLLNMPLPLQRPAEVRPPMAYSRPMLTTPAGALPPPQPPSVQHIRLPRGMNVDTVPLIVRGPMDPARLLLVPPGVGQPVRLAEATALVGLPRIVCPPAQATMADLVRLTVGQPQPPPGTILSGPPFVSANQVMVRPAPMMIQHLPERTESPQSAPPVITVSQVPRISASNQLLVSSMPEMPLRPHGGQPSLPNISVPPRPPAQPQTAPSPSYSSASSPSSGSQDAEDMLLERYSAKPEPPQSVFPSQKAPDPPKPSADVEEKAPDQMSEELEKSSDSLPPPEPPPSLPVPDLKTTVTKSSEIVPLSTSVVALSTLGSLPSDPRLLVQFLLKQTRQSTDVSGSSVSEASKPSPPPELHVASENSPDISENSPEKASKNNIAYSPSQADYLGEDDDGQPLENVRETKVCLR